MPSMTKSEYLIHLLHRRFSYTADNNPDLISDPSYPMSDTVDELTVQWAYNYIIAHLSRVDPEIDEACWGEDD